MIRQTSISEDIRTAGLRRQHDEHAKRILGNRQVLAALLEQIVPEYQGYSREEILNCIESDIHISKMPVRPGSTIRPERLSGNNTESLIPGEGKVTFDIRFRARIPMRKAPARLLINLEAQKKYHMPYHISTRGIFYSARMISEQLDTEFSWSEYQNLQKVYSIWICMNAPFKTGNALAQYTISKEDMIGHIPEKRIHYDKLAVSVICMNEDAPLPEKKGVHLLLHALFSHKMKLTERERILTEEYGIVLEEETKRRLEEMCNLSEGIEERALEKGIQIGRKSGRRAGRKEGFAAGQRSGRAYGLRLAGQILRLSSEGKSAEEISGICEVSVDSIHELLAGL